MLSEQERKALAQFAEGSAGIFALPPVHPSDMQDIVFHVHAIQNIVMARAAVRAHPDEFHREDGFE
jgi:hypothetical protein